MVNLDSIIYLLREILEKVKQGGGGGGSGTGGVSETRVNNLISKAIEGIKGDKNIDATLKSLSDSIGNLPDLPTNDKTSIVSSIKEVVDKLETFTTKVDALEEKADAIIEDYELSLTYI